MGCSAARGFPSTVGRSPRACTAVVPRRLQTDHVARRHRRPCRRCRRTCSAPRPSPYPHPGRPWRAGQPGSHRSLISSSRSATRFPTIDAHTSMHFNSPLASQDLEVSRKRHRPCTKSRSGSSVQDRPHSHPSRPFSLFSCDPSLSLLCIFHRFRPFRQSIRVAQITSASVP
ncbi:hypothetical protein PUNSTDRAFT_142430 [Punctularia strigosozonata HHB-11173 SS5]|uniref:uncharacterized protein n=1 Tax=Punctularia strigosozonata (strain HHB-11173) TaxID=741275 RepID=UPI000441654B|nr:uncharacterized protein PUNSTDRAFT_142430 [Punctularia strigosozonata HHB-11173 SS5]EIN10399.1 hypothetical protein PUNSTDRAFT_142430 [Punctularia strigosozonata HHB-11173 SS5]